jgi:hypothetical protein
MSRKGLCPIITDNKESCKKKGETLDTVSGTECNGEFRRAFERNELDRPTTSCMIKCHCDDSCRN